MDPVQLEDLEAQKSAEKKDENCGIKDDENDTIAATVLSSESPRSSVNTDSKDHASGSKSDTKNNNSADPDTGGMSQAPGSNSFRREIESARQGLLIPMPIMFSKTMATVNIILLQNDLKEVQKNILDGEISSEDKRQYARRLEDLLHRFTTAIRDYDYMTGLEDRLIPPARKHKDITFKQPPTRSMLPSDPLRRLLSRILPGTWAWTDEEIARFSSNSTDSRVYPMVRGFWPQITSPFVDRLARFIVAITGGLSLVVPMLIMRIHQSPNKSLITTSVAVVLFSGVVSVGFRASNAETLGITAAYAAVLVVFVGTSA